VLYLLTLVLKHATKSYTRPLIQKKDNGWKYSSENGTEYCDLELFWNNENWKFEINFKQSNPISRTLEKLIFASLVDIAISESKSNDTNDSYDELIWIALFASK
jgi:hypothetical protein